MYKELKRKVIESDVEINDKVLNTKGKEKVFDCIISFFMIFTIQSILLLFCAGYLLARGFFCVVAAIVIYLLVIKTEFWLTEKQVESIADKYAEF